MQPRQPLINIFLEINAQINLSAIRDSEGVYTKHILDSLELTKLLDLTQVESVCDVGTGGGFPLLALAKYNAECTMHNAEGVMNTDSEFGILNCKFVGIDARRKKIDAINTMIDQLGLQNCKAIWTRIEDHQIQYDIVTARAVAYADKIIPRCVPLCKPGGKICLYKQVDAVEREEILKQCQKYRLTLQQEHVYTLFAGDIERVIYVLRLNYAN